MRRAPDLQFGTRVKAWSQGEPGVVALGGDHLRSRQFAANAQTPLRIDLTYTNRDQVETITRYSDLAGTTKVGSSTYTYNPVGQFSNLSCRNGSGSLLANYTYTSIWPAE